MTKVLIVEDDPFLNRAYQTILGKEGFEVLSADNGATGLELAEKQGVDLILLDMLMPEMGGMDFLRAFRQPTDHRDTKIIVFSNMSTPESIQETQVLGASRYLTKATESPKEMVAVIREVLAEK